MSAIRLLSVNLLVNGIVQGVGYRPFVYRIATKYKLRGQVQNLGDAGVRIIVEGPDKSIENFLVDLKQQKPSVSFYEKIAEKKEVIKEYSFQNFTIIKSDPTRLTKYSHLPPDIAICNECLKDFQNPQSRYKNYPFTTCAACGPRFTTIYDLPYDRERTSLFEFPLCSKCEKEYASPLDRRHHAQGMICPDCGPHYGLYGQNNELLADKNPIEEAADYIQEGKVIAIKGIGGIHIASLASDDDIVQRLREKRRKESRKPFAVMAGNVKKTQEFAIVDGVARDLLVSWRRPIVLLPQREPFPLSKYVAPKLSNIGVFLPYMGMHYLLFSYLPNEVALLMTSANLPNQPMLLDNDRTITQLKDQVDFFLLHNRQIVNRCDDSVIKLINSHPTIIRRARGYVPDPIQLPFKSKLQGICVGPELSSTGAVVTEGKIFPTQHIGDIETLENKKFLESAIEFLLKIFHIDKPDWIAHDKHPDFISTYLAQDLSKEFNAHLQPTQHHHAHAASLMIDAKCQPDEQIVCIAADGFGFGTIDDPAWGGEILLASLDEYSRLGSLKPQPMPGGDRCAQYPGRMVASLLAPYIEEGQLIELLLKRCKGSFPHGKQEIEITLNQIREPKLLTSSTGRVLDALSCLLGFTMERTYEGEPAIILEGQAMNAHKSPEFSIEQFNDKIIQLSTGDLAIRVLHALKTSSWSKNEIAYGIQKSLGMYYGKLAVEIAQNEGVKKIGFTGGVAYNEIITKSIADIISEEKMTFLTHINIPPGDAGISIGQAAITAWKTKGNY